MLKVYVAGPYRAKTEEQILANIKNAEQIALTLWEWGFAVFCPHKNTAHFEKAQHIRNSVWLEGGLAFLQVCDILVVSPGWEHSEGTITEINFAKEQLIPIYFWANPTDREILQRIGEMYDE